jgi:hypothetical protein
MTDGATPRSPLGWRYFRIREVALARAWATAGGIAVHENLFRSRGRRTAHLLARDELALVEAAVAVGCSPWWIQRTRTVHFDLVEVHLRQALERCGVPPEVRDAGGAPPAGDGPAPAPGDRS